MTARLNRWDPYKPITKLQQQCLGALGVRMLECLYGCVVVGPHGQPLWFPTHPCEHDARYA